LAILLGNSTRKLRYDKVQRRPFISQNHHWRMPRACAVSHGLSICRDEGFEMLNIWQAPARKPIPRWRGQAFVLRTWGQARSDDHEVG
jgi:hypothetical protein